MLLLRKAQINTDVIARSPDVVGTTKQSLRLLPPPPHYVRGRRRNDNGFMLLEVLLSVVIIASGVLFITRSYVTSIRASEISTRLTKACLFLEDKLFDIDIKGFREGLEDTEDNGAEEGYTWNLIGRADDKEKITDVSLQLVWKRHLINIMTLRKYKEE